MEKGKKFEKIKKELIEQNERKYGEEIREKYGDVIVEKSTEKISNMTQEEYDKITKLTNDIFIALNVAFEAGDPSSELAQKLAKLHRDWISFYWGFYTKDAHAQLAQMYVDDMRFRTYYDKEKVGKAEFLRDTILAYTEKLK